MQELGYWSITEHHGGILYMKGLSFLHSTWRELGIHKSQYDHWEISALATWLWLGKAERCNM